MLLRLGAAKKEAGRAFRFVKIRVPDPGQVVTRETFHFQVDTAKLRAAELRDGHYLLRSNLTAEDPAVLWTRYVQLTQIEAAFRSLKSELGIRPIYHHLEHRVDAHIFIAFLAYCLQVTLRSRLRPYAPGLTPWPRPPKRLCGEDLLITPTESKGLTLFDVRELRRSG